MANALERRLTRVVDHIHDNPTGDLSLDALAEVAAFSRFHFHRAYRAVTGETAAQTVRRMRLHRAAVALVRTAQPLAQVARDVGYPNLSSFARAFTDAYGTPPAAFRARGEIRPVPPARKEPEVSMHTVEIRPEPARRLAAMSHTGPYHEIGRAFEKLSAVMAARGLFAQSGFMVAVYYDDPATVAPDALHSHAAFEVLGDAVLAPPLGTVLLPEGRAAVLTYTGPYAGLPAAWNQLYGDWLAASGETPADVPAFEVYLNSPMGTAPEALVTEIHLPLR